MNLDLHVVGKMRIIQNGINQKNEVAIAEDV